MNRSRREGPAPTISRTGPALTIGRTGPALAVLAVVLVLIVCAAAGAPQPAFRPEKSVLKVGIPVNATSFMPIYIIRNYTAGDEGLQIEIVVFRGDAGVSQALAANSIDVALASLNGLINMISAGHKVKAFYAGFWMADFEFYARPEIKSWADARGKSFGMTTPGSLTDNLTRYALLKHGLTPDRDVHVVPVGPSAQSLQAMLSGRLDASILNPPINWEAADMQMTLLGTQKSEVAPRWPKHVYYAQEAFLSRYPNTIKALLRAHVGAIQRARANPAETIQLLIDAVKFDPKFGKRAYEGIINDYDVRGHLPDAYMPVFWDIAKRTGDVTEPWPKQKFLDPRFIDSFEQWKP